MVIQRSQHGLDSNLRGKSASEIITHLREIAAGLIIISLTSKCSVPYFLTSNHIGSRAYIGQYLPPGIFIQMRHLIEIHSYKHVYVISQHFVQFSQKPVLAIQHCTFQQFSCTSSCTMQCQIVLVSLFYSPSKYTF